jgi:hypothetical protein
MDRKPMNSRVLPIFLGVACFIPAAAGLYRIGDLVWSWEWALQYAADRVDTLPLFLHAVCAVAFILLGALQILPGFRAASFTRHRKLGRLAALAGLIGAMSGVWMTLSHPAIPPYPARSCFTAGCFSAVSGPCSFCSLCALSCCARYRCTAPS